MMKFKVLVTRDCTESVSVEVEADSRDEAAGKACSKAYGDYDLEWTYNDGSGSDYPYLGDEDEDVEEVE